MEYPRADRQSLEEPSQEGMERLQVVTSSFYPPEVESEAPGASEALSIFTKHEEKTTPKGAEDAPMLPVSSLPGISNAPPTSPRSLPKDQLDRSMMSMFALQESDKSSTPISAKMPSDASTSGRSEEELQGDREAAIAQGLASLMGPVVREMDARMQATFKSQEVLEAHVVRLMNELDKMLEDTPVPLVMQHAAKLVSVRKRVQSLASTLRTIQGRIKSINRLLSDQGAAGSPKKSPSRSSPRKSWFAPLSPSQPEVQFSSFALPIPVPPTLPLSRSGSPTKLAAEAGTGPAFDTRLSLLPNSNNSLSLEYGPLGAQGNSS